MVVLVLAVAVLIVTGIVVVLVVIVMLLLQIMLLYWFMYIILYECVFRVGIYICICHDVGVCFAWVLWESDNTYSLVVLPGLSCQSGNLSVCLFPCLLAYLFVCLCACVLVCLGACLSVCIIN